MVNNETWGNTYKPATVPGCAQLDLMNNNIIPDPYYRDNSNFIDWVI